MSNAPPFASQGAILSVRGGFRAGDVVGGYALLRRIGRGGMAEVWVARKRCARGKYVALKLMLPSLVDDPRFTRLFAAEARLSISLSHSNIVQVFDVGHDQNVDFLVMEWIDGVNLVGLRDALAHVERRERVEVAAFIVGQLLHALSYAHSITTHRGRGLGIVHRDVSPQNVLISNAGEVKLADFGVAHTVIDESTGRSVRGKLRYMSPEQLGGDTHAKTVDLYAAGAILHELATASRFRGTTRDERVLHGQVARGAIPQTPVPLPPKLEELRVALLQPDPSRRVSTADAGLEMLCEFAGYRDKRRAVSRLCGALTGVVRPRTSPTARMSRSPSGSAPRAWARTFTPPQSSAAELSLTPTDALKRLERPRTNASTRTAAPVRRWARGTSWALGGLLGTLLAGAGLGVGYFASFGVGAAATVSPVAMADPKTSDSPTAPRVHVQFHLDGVTTAWIRMGDQSVSIVPDAHREFVAGAYPVFKKHSPEERFTTCGSLDLHEGYAWDVFVGPNTCRATPTRAQR